MIFDTHIHLNEPRILANLDVYLAEAISKGINNFLCVGWDVDSSKKAVEIANNYKGVYAAVGVIPTEHKTWDKDSIEEIRKLAKSSKKVVAIGEIGLDYYWENSDEIKIKQKEMFIAQLQLAEELDLPISIHCRDAIQDTFDIVKKFPKVKGIMHCYSGSYEMAKEFAKLGYKIALGGALTFKNAVKPKEVLEKLDLKNIVFETDAPYLAPMPYRGKLNEPAFIYETVKFAAKYLNMDQDELENIAYKNSLEILRIDE